MWANPPNMSRFVATFAIFSHLLPFVLCEGFYSIVAPGTIRPNSEYHVAVSVHKNSEPSSIKVGIISKAYSNFQTVDMRPYSTKLIRFEIPSLKRDVYKLTAEGITGVEFTNETILNFEDRQTSVLIQTDKAIYKPGDKIRYRALVLDSYLRPAKILNGITVLVKDGGKNLLQLTKNARLISGVYSGELQLSDFPMLGQWTIEVNAMNETHSKMFEVAEYILPKFDVSIETPRHAIYKDGKISATIKAKYNFGKPIKGEATVSIYPKFYGAIQPFLYDLITRKVIPINGKASVEFDIKEELKFKEDFQRDIILEAIVEERSNGRKQNTTKTVTIHKDKYAIETVKMPKNYIPNVPFEVIVKVVQHDGTPVMDSSNPLMSYIAKGLSGENSNRTEHRLDNTGMVKMMFTLPDDHSESYSINVEYLSAVSSLGQLEKKKILNGRFLQIEVLTPRPTVNNEIAVSVRSNSTIRYFMYQVLGRGDIVTSNVVDVPDTNKIQFKFLATSAMIPRAKLYVYYIDNGDFIFDEETIELGEELGNFVRIDAPSKTTPGQDIDITITTKPNSYVGLMAVDQSASMLESGNDLTYATVFEELQKYESATPGSDLLMRYPGQESGVVTLTNADFVFERTPSDAIPAIPTYQTPVAESVDGSKETTIKKTDIGPAHKFELNTKPPLAGPYAFSRIPKPFWNRPRVHVMHDIMDTWLFMNMSSGSEGRTTIHKKIPESLTSWVLSGFSLDPVTGLGLTLTPRNTQSLQQFYITTDLPYSVKTGETISIPVVVFNYLDRSLDVEVTLYNTAQEFEFVDVNNQISETSPKIKLYLRKSVSVPTNSGQTLAFIIRPKKIGRLSIKLTANSPLSSDTIEKSLLVEPAGVTEYVNKGILIDLRDKAEQKENITIDIPRNVVDDSVHIEVSVVGDLLGPTIKNLDNLIRKPRGSNEQNMITMVPNILVLKYLEKSKQLTPAIEIQARKNLEIGYQRQLAYKHKDGSFSAFGSSDPNGSMWLTAYVARYFRQAADYTLIDEEIIREALEYLAKNQAANGSFVETGMILERQHAIDKGVALTAFTLLAFLENVNQLPKYRNVISKALDYIVRNADVNGDVYSFALATYALQLADHNAKISFIQNLDGRATTDADKKWWNEPIPESQKKSPWYNGTRSLNIEVTSYALAAFLEAGLLTDSLPILKWLIAQRNSNGGFESTQDTVVGLMAIIKFAERISFEDSNVQVVVSYGDGAETRMNVNEVNSIVLQSYVLPPTIRNITITGSGRGIALAQISYRYNVNVTGAWPRFSLDPQVNRISHSEYLHLSICTNFVPAPGGTNESNMAVMEVTFPSGFTADLDTLPSLEATKRIKKVETKNGDTKVLIYFDSLDRNEVCPTLDAYKTHKVANQKPASVIIYDYYDNVHKARMFYSAPRSTLCDICEGKDCGNSCSERAETRQSDGDGGGSEIDDLNKSSGRFLLPSITALLICSILTIKFT